jgi:tetratricopeptide (TPR) repeat protein
VGLSLGIPYLHPLLSHLPGLDATHRAQRRDPLKGESLMLAGDEAGVLVVDPAQKGTGTAVAVLYPEVMRWHGLQHLPEQRALWRLAVFTGKDLAHEARRGLVHDEGLARQGAGLPLAAALDDPRRLAQVSFFLCNHFFMKGAYDQAIAAGQRARALATACGEIVLPTLVHYYLGVAYRCQGDYRRAIACFEQTVASLEGAQRYEFFGQLFPPAVFSRAWLAGCHAELGTFPEDRACGDEGLQIAEAVAHPGSLMIASYGVGQLARRHGDLGRALPLLERAVGLCQDAALSLFFPSMAAALGAVYTLGGRVADAVSLLTQALEQSVATGNVAVQAVGSLTLGEGQLLAGRLAEAHALTERALAHARAHQERGHEAYALRLLGEIAAHRGLPDAVQAEAHYQQALTLADELGMHPLVAHCHLGLGLLYRKIGRGEQVTGRRRAMLWGYRISARMKESLEHTAAMSEVVHKSLSVKNLHGVSSGNVHECLLRSSSGKVRSRKSHSVMCEPTVIRLRLPEACNTVITQHCCSSGER